MGNSKIPARCRDPDHPLLLKEENTGGRTPQKIQEDNEMVKKKDIYFTVTGLHGFADTEFFKEGMKVKLEKEPDNDYDSEAIMVKLAGLGKVGYVANSVRTVVGDEAYSAGRLYDKFGDESEGTILYNMGNALQCRFDG